MVKRGKERGKFIYIMIEKIKKPTEIERCPCVLLMQWHAQPNKSFNSMFRGSIMRMKFQNLSLQLYPRFHYYSCVLLICESYLNKIIYVWWIQDLTEVCVQTWHRKCFVTQIPFIWSMMGDLSRLDISGLWLTHLWFCI